MTEELILLRITGEDRPGLTASIMDVLARYDVDIQDIGQADIHSTLSLGILILVAEKNSGYVMKELLFKASELGVNITCLLYTSPSPRDKRQSRMPSSA